MYPVENYKRVADLANFDMTYESPGGSLRRRGLWSRVVYEKQGWATVFCSYVNYQSKRGWETSPSYRLVRLRHVRGLWHPHNHFNLKDDHLPQLMLALSDKIRGVYATHEADTRKPNPERGRLPHGETAATHRRGKSGSKMGPGKSPSRDPGGVRAARKSRTGSNRGIASKKAP